MKNVEKQTILEKIENECKQTIREINTKELERLLNSTQKECDEMKKELLRVGKLTNSNNNNLIGMQLCFQKMEIILKVVKQEQLRRIKKC